MYVIVRADIPAPHLTVQASHAAIASERVYGEPHKPHPNLVVCTLPDEQSLDSFFNRLKEIGIPVCAWREEDMGGSLTAVATGPLRGEQRRPLRNLKLLR